MVWLTITQNIIVTNSAYTAVHTKDTEYIETIEYSLCSSSLPTEKREIHNRKMKQAHVHM